MITALNLPIELSSAGVAVPDGLQSSQMSHEEATEAIRSTLAGMADRNGILLVQGVDVQGRCRPALIRSHIQPLFRAYTVNDVLEAMKRVQMSLYSLGVFKDVALSITPEKVVSINLQPKNKFVARVGTNVGQAEGSGYIRGTMCNVSGWGEVVTVDTSAGTRTKSSHLLSTSLPLPFQSTVGWKAETTAYSSEKLLEWASCKAYVKGISGNVSRDNGVSFGWDAVLRTLAATRLNAGECVKHDAGNNFKLGMFFNWRYDTRNLTETLMGRERGWLIDLRNEMAVPPSSSPFMKSVIGIRSAFDVYKEVSAAINAKCGIIVPLISKSTHIIDRLYLGGPLDVRGFRLNHAGPHEGPDATGGDLMAAVGMSLFTPLPKVDNPHLKLHSFCNAGLLSPLTTNPKSLFPPSVTTGFGIVYSHPSARFELNITMPLIARSNEIVHKGLQFGVGLEFL